MELYEFLTTTTGGKCLFTMLVSMLPIIERCWACPPIWPFRRRW